jgi:hypothetical protein
VGVVDNRAKLVAGTKTLHDLLPDLVVPMDRVWTGMFFRLHSHEWQVPTYQRRTFPPDTSKLLRDRPQGSAAAVCRRSWLANQPHQILDNALIGFCKVKLSDELDEQATDIGRALSFSVPGLPPAKNEDLSMLGAGHSHAPRVLELLRAAKEVLQHSGFVPVDGSPVALDVVVHAPPGKDPWDATNYLGGVADVLEEKSRRGTLDHLDELRHVWVYRNDRQIKEVSYRQLEASDVYYTVRIREFSNPSGL